jgi:hypothetical protein
MKKLLLSLLFAAVTVASIGQTCIEYKSTGIIIRPSLIGRESNIIRYSVTAPISMIDTAQTLLGIKMECSNGVCTYGTTVSVTDLPMIYEITNFEQEDMGVSAAKVEQRFGCNLILGLNLLKLNGSWTIKNK